MPSSSMRLACLSEPPDFQQHTFIEFCVSDILHCRFPEINLNTFIKVLQNGFDRIKSDECRISNCRLVFFVVPLFLNLN